MSENSNLKIFEKQQIKFSEHINETGYKPDINRSKVARLFEISSIYYNTLVKKQVQVSRKSLHRVLSRYYQISTLGVHKCKIQGERIKQLIKYLILRNNLAIHDFFSSLGT